METLDHDRMLEKVRKLLAKAESTNHEAESDSYRDMATAIMTKYAIDAALISINTNNGPRPIIQKRFDIVAPFGYEKATLWNFAAKAFGATCVQTKVRSSDHNPSFVTLFGTETSLELIESVVTSIMIQATRQVMDINPFNMDWSAGEHRAAVKRARKAFLAGFYNRTGIRLVVAHKDAMNENADSSAALVLVSDAKRADSAMHEAFSKLGTVKDRSYDPFYAAKGSAAGNAADIGQTSVQTNRKALGG